MQLKFALLASAVLSVAYAQTVSFNASQVITELENLINLNKVTQSIAGNITLGNLVPGVLNLVGSLTTDITTLLGEVVHIGFIAANSVFGTLDQAQICLSLSELISTEEDSINSIGSISLIDAPPLNGIIAGALSPIGTILNSLVNAILPHVGDCVGTSGLNLSGLESTLTKVLQGLGIQV